MSDCPDFDFANMCKYIHRCIKWCNMHHSSRKSASHHSDRAWLFRQWDEINERTYVYPLIDSFSCVNLEIAMQLHNDSRSQNHDNDTSCIRSTIRWIVNDIYCINGYRRKINPEKFHIFYFKWFLVCSDVILIKQTNKRVFVPYPVKNLIHGNFQTVHSKVLRTHF